MQTPTKFEDAFARAARGEMLGPMDVAALLCLGPSAFNQRNRKGEFDFLKVKPAVGPHCFSGFKVHRYIQGEALEEPQTLAVFGRKRRVS